MLSRDRQRARLKHELRLLHVVNSACERGSEIVSSQPFTRLHTSNKASANSRGASFASVLLSIQHRRHARRSLPCNAAYGFSLQVVSVRFYSASTSSAFGSEHTSLPNLTATPIDTIRTSATCFNEYERTTGLALRAHRATPTVLLKFKQEKQQQLMRKRLSSPKCDTSGVPNGRARPANVLTTSAERLLKCADPTEWIDHISPAHALKNAAFTHARACLPDCPYNLLFPVNVSNRIRCTGSTPAIVPT